MDRQEGFFPETVDEQVDQLASFPLHEQFSDSSLIHDLRDVYTESEEAQMLASVWERLVEHIEESEAQYQPGAKKRQPQNAKILHRGRIQYMQQQTFHRQQSSARRWSLIAAILCAALLVGSMAWVFTLVRHPNTTAASPNRVTTKHTPQATSSTPSGLYLGGQNGVLRVDVNTGAVIWHVTVNPAPSAPAAFKQSAVNNLVVVDDTVYATDQDGIFYAFNAQNGAIRWSHTFLMEMSKPFIADGVLYIPATDSKKGYVYAFNPNNGTELKRYQFPVSSLDPYFNVSVTNNALYVTGFYTLFALNLADGSQLWQKQISQQQILNAPQVIDGVLYTSSSEVSQHNQNEAQDSYIYAFNARNGNQLWQSSKINGFVFNITVANNAIYCGAQNHHVYAYDEHDGHLLWTQDIGGDALGAPQVTDGFVYFDAPQAGLPQFVGIVALNATDGSVKWRKPNISSQMFPSFGLANGVLYVPNVSPTAKRTSGGVEPSFTAYALKAADGTVVWTSKLPMEAQSMAVIP